MALQRSTTSAFTHGFDALRYSEGAAKLRGALQTRDR